VGQLVAKEEHTIVLIFGWTLGGFVASMAAVIVGLLVGGPVGRFKGSVGKDGASFEGAARDDDDEGPPHDPSAATRPRDRALRSAAGSGAARAAQGII
jgi:hypothetical protein